MTNLLPGGGPDRPLVRDLLGPNDIRVGRDGRPTGVRVSGAAARCSILEGLCSRLTAPHGGQGKASPLITPLRLEDSTFCRSTPDGASSGRWTRTPSAVMTTWPILSSKKKPGSMVMLEWGSCGLVATTGPAVPGEATEEDRGSGGLESRGSRLRRLRAVRAAARGPACIEISQWTGQRRCGAAHLDGVESDPATDGLQHELVARVVAELIRRGVPRASRRSVGRRWPPTCSRRLPSTGGPPRSRPPGDCSFDQCMIAADFLQEVGFVVVSPHPYFPGCDSSRRRGWAGRREVEAALERLLESSQLEQPVGAGSTISAQPAGG